MHGRSQIGGHALICGTAVIAGPLRIGGNVVIGDGADIASAADFETHRLSWGETITLYRCEDGAVGLGRTSTDHGPITGRSTAMLNTVISRRVAELAEIWATLAVVEPE